jgi:hypothetical protein
MDSEPKDSNCLYIFQMFKSTYWPHFFLTLTLLCTYTVQPDKILRKNVNFKELKWTRTQKIRIFVTDDCLDIFADFKQQFDLIF